MKIKPILGIAMLSLLLTSCNKEADEAEQTQIPETQLENISNDIVFDIDYNKTHQTIEGFGAGYTYYSNYAYFAQYKDEIYDLLFDDANLSILRFKNSYLYNTEEDFNPKVEREFYEKAKERLQKKGIEPQVLMSSWSPALYLKDSECLYGEGTLAKDNEGSFVYDEHGEYWHDLVQAYGEQGVPIDLISIQNEPDYVAAYESCTFKFTESENAASYPKAFVAVYDAIQKLDHPPKMLAPETMSCDPADISLIIDEILDLNPNSLYGIGHHLYVGGDEEDPKSFNSNFRKLSMSYPDLPKWQTEYYRGNFMTTVQLIQNALTIENLNAYIFWGGVWFANVEKELDNLIGIDSGRNEEEWDYEHGYVIGEKFYSMKHFSEYILPNYIRIDCKLNSNQEYSTDEISSSAYISPNKDKVVIVSVNDTSSEQSFQFNIPKYKVNQSKIILSNYQNGIDSEDFYVDSGSLDDTGTFIIPAHSVITVVLDGQCQ